MAATKSGYESAAAKLAAKRACLVECEREHSALAAEKSELQGKLGEAAAERKRVAHRCARLDAITGTLAVTTWMLHSDQVLSSHASLRPRVAP